MPTKTLKCSGKIMKSDITITISDGPSLPVHASLSEYSWSELKQLSEALVNNTLSVSDLSSVHNISATSGATKTATINGETHPFRVVGVLHDYDTNGNKIGFTFEQTDLMNSYYVMKDNMSESDNWANSDLITTINNFTVESDLNNVITPARKVCCNSVTSSGTYNHTSKLWIMSETEIANSQSYTYGSTVEGSPYAYYTNASYSSSSRIKQKSGSTDWYWLRSPQGTFPSPGGVFSYFAGVSSRGALIDYYAYNELGVGCCFCV